MVQNQKMRWIQTAAFLLCSVLLIMVLGSSSVHAAGVSQKVYDEAGLFTDEEVQVLEEQAAALADRLNYDVAIATIDDAEGMETYRYAMDFYDSHGIGVGSNYLGILLLIDMDNREVYIDEHDSGVTQLEISTAERDAILDVIMEYAYDGDYYGVAASFLQEFPKYIGNGESGVQDYVDDQPKTPWERMKQRSGIAAIIASIVSACSQLGLRSGQKSGGTVTARSYQKDKTNLKRKEDRFIETTTVRRLIETENRNGGSNNDVHHENGHSGGGRKF